MKRRDPKATVGTMKSKATMRWPSLSYGTLPVIVFILISFTTLVIYGVVFANIQDAYERSLGRRIEENALRLTNSFESYANLLRGATGLMQTGGVSQEEWHKFMSVYRLDKNFSGMEAIGVAYGNTPQSAVVAYVNPETEQTKRAVGINVAMSQTITADLEQAAKSGTSTISETLPNLFSTKADVTSTTNGFLMYKPFYDRNLPQSNDEERLRALKGYTIALFRGDIFFEHVFRGIDLNHTTVKIYVGDEHPSNLQYFVANAREGSQRTMTKTVDMFGKPITMSYTRDTAYILPTSPLYQPHWLLIGGLIAAILIAGISGYLLRSRYRRLAYQKEQDVNFAKDELLSLASHQLRTPATGVKQYLGMVLQGFAGELSDQQKTYLERAYSSNNRQLHVINDILHLAKLEAGRIVLAEHKFDLSEMIREVMDEQRDDAKRGEVDIELQAPPRGVIIGDSHMLRMVVENLISNAIKYTAPGGKVTVRLNQRGKSWVISVKDTGVGIAGKDLGKLFKQFSRISNARSDFVTGTGIGLYLAHHLVVLHGGTISVSSSESKGSTFTVRLPKKV